MAKLFLFGSAAASYFVYQYGLHVNPFTGRRELLLIPSSLELLLGEIGAQGIIEGSKDKILPDTSPEHLIVDAVSRKLIDQVKMQRNWTVTVIDDPVINAFVTPNGSVFVNTGLLHVLDNVDELGMVIGHELSHVYMRHGISKLSVSLVAQGAWYLLQFFVIGDVITTSKLPMELIANLPYSRHKEIEADQCGMELASQAGYRLEACGTMLQKLKSSDSLIEEFFSTHPITEHRVEAVKKQEKKLLERYSAQEFEQLRKQVHHTEELFKKYKLTRPVIQPSVETMENVQLS